MINIIKLYIFPVFRTDWILNDLVAFDREIVRIDFNNKEHFIWMDSVCMKKYKKQFHPYKKNQNHNGWDLLTYLTRSEW
jgi:hypothetical protein